MDEIDIGPVIKHYGSDPPKGLIVGGRWCKVPCINPKHPDENASASTNGLGFRCHACGFTGNAITIICELEEVNVSSALRFYEELSGEKLPALSQPTRRGRKRVSDEGARTKRGDDSPVSARSRRRPRAGT